MQHALTSLPLSKPQLFPTTQPITPPRLPQNPLSQYKQPCIRAKRVSSIQLDWSYDWQIHFISFFSLCTFLQVPLIKVKLDSDGSISYQVKISLNAKRVQCLKGLSELERIRVVAFPERRKKIIEKIKKRWLTFFLFCFGPTTLYSSSAVG